MPTLPNDRELLTRKDVAALLEMSVKFVISNEERLGLRAARVDLGARSVRYRRRAVTAILASRKIICDGNQGTPGNTRAN